MQQMSIKANEISNHDQYVDVHLYALSGTQYMGFQFKIRFLFYNESSEITGKHIESIETSQTVENLSLKQKASVLHMLVYIYIYIYICVCVSVCASEDERCVQGKEDGLWE
jgi:beta-galactosidase beta subunit